MKTVIAGGAGTLGQRIAADLAQIGNEIVVLTRAPRPGFPFRQVAWDGRTVGDWSKELEGSVLINLAGELVDRRPTPPNIELLRRSRVEPTTALVQASQECSPPPIVWVQGSSTAIYGDAGDALITEESAIRPGPPQMPGVALPWEEAAKGANSRRQVIFRMSLVLDRRTPVLDRLSMIVKLGLGGRISTGRQWVSWIHVQGHAQRPAFRCGERNRGSSECHESKSRAERNLHDGTEKSSQQALVTADPTRCLANGVGSADCANREEVRASKASRIGICLRVPGSAGCAG
jgi:NAD dependent epimerase/dehydratase family enzyme